MANYNKARVTLTNTAGKGAFRAANGFTLFISNEDMNDIIKIIKSIDDLGVLIDEVTETVNDGIKKQEGGFLGALLPPLATSLVQTVISSVIEGTSGIIREVTRSGREYINKNF